MNEVMPDLSSTFPGRPVYDDQLYRPRAAHLSRPLHKAKHRAGNLVLSTFHYILYTPGVAKLA